MTFMFVLPKIEFLDMVPGYINMIKTQKLLFDSIINLERKFCTFTTVVCWNLLCLQKYYNNAGPCLDHSPPSPEKQTGAL